MTPARFTALAAAFGSDLERWPAADRDAAKRHLAETPAAEAILWSERALDGVLSASRVAAPGADRERQIVTAVYRERTWRERRRRWGRGLWMISALGCGAATGIAAMALVYLPLRTGPNPEGSSSLYEQTSFGDLASFDDTAALGKGV